MFLKFMHIIFGIYHFVLLIYIDIAFFCSLYIININNNNIYYDYINLNCIYIT